MPGPIDKALSGNTLAMSAGVRDQAGMPAPDAGLSGGAGDIIAALMNGQVGAEQLLQLLMLLSAGGEGLGQGPAPAPGPAQGPPGMGPMGPAGPA